MTTSRGTSSQHSPSLASCAPAQGKTVSEWGGQIATSPEKLRTADTRAMRKSSLRFLRLREASGISQEELGKRVGVTERSIGSLERAEVRGIALQAFFVLLDEVIEKKGLDVALAAILTSTDGHALRGALGHAPVAKSAPTPNEGGNPSRSAKSNTNKEAA